MKGNHMRIFISAGEPSGDLHGANLIRSLQKLDPSLEFVGFGGERMEQAGCRLLFPLTQLAVMWFLRVLANLHVFLSLASKADRYFRHQKPDALILIDYPGFNGVLGRRAHFHGIPVFYYNPPQMWAWGSWRIKGLRRWVDHVLCTLSFEQKWYQQRGVNAQFVGHPYFDELHNQHLDQDFIWQQENRKGRIVALLPGSRTQELENNLESQLRAASIIHQKQPDTRFSVACFKEEHRKIVLDQLKNYSFPVEVHVGRTPEIITLAHSCLSVSGSVSLELLFREKPTVIVYRVSKTSYRIGKFFITSKYITLVNLLADKELFPEFLVDHCPAHQISDHILNWLQDADQYQQTCQELATLRNQVAQPGSCQRTAEYVFETLTGSNASTAQLPLSRVA